MLLRNDILHVVHFRTKLFVSQVKLEARSSEIVLEIERVYCMIFQRHKVSTVTKLPLWSVFETLMLIDVHLLKELLLLRNEHARVIIVVAFDDEKQFVFCVGLNLIAPL